MRYLWQTQNFRNTRNLRRCWELTKAAVEEWIAAVREEESLASLDPVVAQLDDWEQAHFREEEARNKAKKAKRDYEDAIRQSLFGF